MYAVFSTHFFCSLRTLKDKSFHCKVCNVCLRKELESNHLCRPNAGNQRCLLCSEVCLIIWNYSLCARTIENPKLSLSEHFGQSLQRLIIELIKTSRQGTGTKPWKTRANSFVLILIDCKSGAIAPNRSLQLYGEKWAASLHRRCTKPPVVI